jgi:hypothetical protein
MDVEMLRKAMVLLQTLYIKGNRLRGGEVHRDDDTNYPSRDYTKTIEITDAQYNDIKAFGEPPPGRRIRFGLEWALK